MNIDFTNREEYLVWRADWKAQYKALSKEIRELKANRRQFTWAWRVQADNSSKKRVKVGDNPNYDSSADWKVSSKSADAFGMLELLADAKAEAGRQREESLGSNVK